MALEFEIYGFDEEEKQILIIYLETFVIKQTPLDNKTSPPSYSTTMLVG